MSKIVIGDKNLKRVGESLVYMDASNLISILVAVPKVMRAILRKKSKHD